MRIFGAVLLVAACTLFGYIQARKLYFRQSCLESVVDALRFIDAELKNCAVPLPEIFSELAKLTNSRMQAFFVLLSKKMESFGEESLSDLWSGCVIGDTSLSLSQRQRQELSRLGNYLGRYSESEQSDAINACIAHTESALRQSIIKARQGAKLYTSLGLTLGLMLATVLI